MMENDIRGRAAAAVSLVAKLASANNQPTRDDILRNDGPVLVQALIEVATQFFVDVNRCAEALEKIALVQEEKIHLKKRSMGL